MWSADISSQFMAYLFNGAFWRTKGYNVDEVQFIKLFSFMDHTYGAKAEKSASSKVTRSCIIEVL